MRLILGGWALTILIGLGILVALETFGWWAVIVPALIIGVQAENARNRARRMRR